jgi:inner membrane protein
VAPALGVGGVVALDLVAAARPWPVPVIGLLDEPAHLLTAWITLCAVAGSHQPAWRWVFLGAVAIDVDHIPLYVWGDAAAAGGRPVTHSLITAVVLLALSPVVPRSDAALRWLGVGVILHFVRDLATGPGVPLLWPVTREPVLLPYRVYLFVLVALAAVAVGRRVRAASVPSAAGHSSSPSSPHPKATDPQPRRSSQPWRT